MIIHQNVSFFDLLTNWAIHRSIYLMASRSVAEANFLVRTPVLSLLTNFFYPLSKDISLIVLPLIHVSAGSI